MNGMTTATVITCETINNIQRFNDFFMGVFIGLMASIATAYLLFAWKSATRDLAKMQKKNMDYLKRINKSS